MKEKKARVMKEKTRPYTFAVSFLGECCQEAHLLVQTVSAPSQLKASVKLLNELKEQYIVAHEICCTDGDRIVKEVDVNYDDRREK